MKGPGPLLLEQAGVNLLRMFSSNTFNQLPEIETIAFAVMLVISIVKVSVCFAVKLALLSTLNVAAVVMSRALLNLLSSVQVGVPTDPEVLATTTPSLSPILSPVFVS